VNGGLHNFLSLPNATLYIKGMESLHAPQIMSKLFGPI